ncbi:hypothetical protein SHJG_8355 [Streptomyces hygroscopicus subsp. jinggangensis 5008]|nr:hypothetical protein SHJG_8355 [Streptomyces hygroscopicus subsp. jinggangensis 5008]AGF67778.1 hypothetical protein SHJGH_8116 [Streptomyces hygroscopicus subsp. jinggangensis TL01]
MGDLASHKCGVQTSRHVHIGDVPAFPGEQPFVLAPCPSLHNNTSFVWGRELTGRRPDPAANACGIFGPSLRGGSRGTPRRWNSTAWTLTAEAGAGRVEHGQCAL